jgi:hypothetical protein
VLDTVNRSGKAYLSHAKVRGRLVIRLSVGQERTTQEHVEAVWAQLLDAARHLPALDPSVTPSVAEAVPTPPSEVTSIVELLAGEPTVAVPTPPRRAGSTLSRVLLATVLAILNIAGIAVGGSLLALVLTERLASDVDGPRIVLLYALVSAGVAVIGAGLAAVAVARRWVGGWWFTVPIAVLASACYAVWTIAPVVWPATF